MHAMLNDVAGKATAGLNTAAEAAKQGTRAVYDSAAGRPKTAAAIIFGTALAAAALWVAFRRPELVSKGSAALARAGKRTLRRTRALASRSFQ